MKSAVNLDVDKICEVAKNGKEALQKVKDTTERNGFCSYSLILMDCNMPHMDGYEATARIRDYLHEQGLVQPIISAVTGHTEQMYVKKAIDSGMNQVLSKPVNHLRLRSLIDKIRI